jgi:hypothetical protein
MTRFITLAAFLLLASLTAAHSSSVTFAWNVDADPTVTGYKLHIGAATGQYAQTFDAGAATTLAVTTLASGNWFAVVKAYNAAGIESASSNEVAFTIPAPTPTPIPTPAPTPQTPTNLHFVSPTP